MKIFGFKKTALLILLTVMIFALLFSLSSCEDDSESVSALPQGNSLFCLLGNKSGSQMMGIVLKTKNGKTIVIDGGTKSNGEYLNNFLSQNSGGHVDAWFFTHPHHDHIGAFSEIFDDEEKISVDNIYHCFPALDELNTHGYRTDDEAETWEDTNDIFETKFSEKVKKVATGEVFIIDDIKITVLRTYNPEMTSDFVNNSSVVYRIENGNKSFLILGDLGVLGGEELMKECDIDLLRTDYTQMAHHGQGGVSREFYEYIEPKSCIWPTPTWLWNNDAGEGFDTGPWQTVRTREWMEELGVTEHYVAKDGAQVIVF